MKANNRNDLLGELLRDVSRSFYLTLRVLPSAVREPISLAYLLARAADTIADTEAIRTSQRLQLLKNFRQVLEQKYHHSLLLNDLKGLISQQHNQQERLLLERIGEAFWLLEQLHSSDRSQVVSVVITLSEGMLFDLETFPPEDSSSVKALPDESVLEHYTYLVAGCVGEFWSDICYGHDGRLAVWDLVEQRALGRQFGKALQLTNILRDIAEDLRIGRCYFPGNQLAELGISVESLFDPDCVEALRPVQREWMMRALEYYRSAGHYIMNTPRRCVKLRLAMLWPVLLGLRTLQLVASSEDYLRPEKRIKVTRSEVYRLLLSSLPIACSNLAIKRWLARLQTEVINELG